jgi:hypothetical protein
MTEPLIIDLSKLSAGLMEAVAKTRPAQVREMREGIRRLLIDNAHPLGCPELAEWAARLPDAALDRLAHMGFSEISLFRSLTGDLEVETRDVRIKPKGGGAPIKPPGRREVRDGQHRVQP